MILVTGDTHGDAERFRSPAVKKLGRKDTVIVCGDFGFVWDGSKEEQKLVKKLGRHSFDILFVEGCRDNYDLLREYPVVAYRGGYARKISGSVYQLLRGEIYEIEGKKVFAFGGGYSDERWLDTGMDRGMWWPEEQPCAEEKEKGLRNLAACGGRVDLVVTHDAPASIRHFIRLEDNEESAVHTYLEQVMNSCSFDHWYFGHYHLDKEIPPRFTAVYQNLSAVPGDRSKR